MLIDFGCLVFDVNVCGVLLFCLFEIVVWAFARWADTYLILEDFGGSLYVVVYVVVGGV